MRTKTSRICLMILCGLSVCATARPVNPNATPEAVAVLNYLTGMMGEGILTGQHDYLGTTSQARSIQSTTGKWPAVWGSDFAYGSDLDSKRRNMVSQAIDMWNNGAIITFTWHEVKPTKNEADGWSYVKTSITDAEYEEIITPGTNLNRRWLSHIDTVASYLKQLQNAHVPVIWRPYHEKNLSGFWWCRRSVAKLHQLMYDRYTNYHHLNNLIWNWNFNAINTWAIDPTPYFPGIEYVDMITIDDYANSPNIPGQQSYGIAKTLAQGKPLGIGENGQMPDPSFIKNSRPDIVYFLTWPLTDPMVENSSSSWINTVYSNSYAITRDEVPNLKLTTRILGNGARPSGLLRPLENRDQRHCLANGRIIPATMTVKSRETGAWYIIAPSVVPGLSHF